MSEIYKLPPQAAELELSVLGACLVDNTALGTIVDLIAPETFYKHENREVWGAIVSLFQQNKPVDMRTVVNELRSTGKIDQAGGAIYIAELTSNVASAANIEYHARVLIEFSIKRELIQVSSRAYQESFESTSDVFEILDSVQSKFDQISSQYFKGSAMAAPQLYKETLNYILTSRNSHGITGVRTGFADLDRVTGGWQAPDLIIIAARPAMGKTVVGVSVAKEAAQKFKKPVGFFSLEMSKRQIMQRMIASDAEVDLDNIIRGTTTETDLQLIAHNTDELSRTPLHIDDTAGISILELRAKARRMKHEHKIEMIVVDYLQLMKGDNSGNREQEIASISRGLKGIAKELNIPVIALSQLSREVEKRADKRPQLSDLRESGAIEQDADVVAFLYRAEYYKIEIDSEGNPTAGVLEIDIAKNRNGKTGSIYLKFIGKHAKIADLHSYSPPQLMKFERNPLVNYSEPMTYDNDRPF